VGERVSPDDGIQQELTMVTEYACTAVNDDEDVARVAIVAHALCVFYIDQFEGNVRWWSTQPSQHAFRTRSRAMKVTCLSMGTWPHSTVSSHLWSGPVVPSRLQFSPRSSFRVVRCMDWCHPSPTSIAIMMQKPIMRKHEASCG